MSLKSGISYWQAVGEPPIAAPPLEGDVHAEVAIIGAGITGALVAYRLVQEGIDVVLLDKRRPGTGSTAASTGLLQYEVDTPLVELMDMVPPEHAVHAYRRGLAAVDEIEQIVDAIGHSCGFAGRDSLYFATHAWHYWRLKREYECRREHGFAVELVDRHRLAEISSIRSAGAIVSQGDAQIDAYQFTQRLLAHARERGLRIFGETAITSIEHRADTSRLEAQGGSITARRIVFATGYDSHRYLKHDPGKLHSTYAVASEPLASQSGWPDRALVWETARPYFYARQTSDGRAVIGGEDTPYANDHERDGLVEAKADRLVRRFKKLFPEIPFEPCLAWAGTFGESPDGLAYIGAPSESPRSYFAIGYGGNGITFSVVASKLIADLYAGRPNADEQVFRFGR